MYKDLSVYKFTMSSHVKSDAFCLVPLHDKVSVVESCIMLLEDTEKALQAKREDINFLMSELSDIEVKTSRLITHLRLNIISLKKEVRAINVQSIRG
jgi:hypothetical protein